MSVTTMNIWNPIAYHHSMASKLGQKIKLPFVTVPVAGWWSTSLSFLIWELLKTSVCNQTSRKMAKQYLLHSPRHLAVQDGQHPLHKLFSKVGRTSEKLHKRNKERKTDGDLLCIWHCWLSFCHCFSGLNTFSVPPGSLQKLLSVGKLTLLSSQHITSLRQATPCNNFSSYWCQLDGFLLAWTPLLRLLQFSDLTFLLSGW